MNIKKYQKLKNGKYQLTLEDGSIITTYEDIILKLELLITKKVDESDLERINTENKKYDAYFTALKYLNVRVRSKKEIITYLKSKDFDNENINDTIVILEKQGYINDDNFAKSFLNNKLITTANGPYKIKRELIDKGISNDIISNTLVLYTNDIQKEKIEKQVNRMIKSNRNKGNNLLKRKIYNELVKNGFDKTLIKDIVDNLNLSSDEELLKKEYDKLYKRLCRKYSGDELEYKIKQKLYQKGFEVVK